MQKLAILLGIWITMFSAERSNAQKMGYVNIQDILTSMPEYAKADTAVGKYQQQLYQQYQAMQQEFQGKADAFVKDSAKMVDAVKRVKRSSLEDMNNRIARFRQNISQEVSNKYEELLKPIIDKVQAAVNALAKAKRYAYVLDDSPRDELPMLVLKPDGDDLTAAVKAQLGLK